MPKAIKGLAGRKPPEPASDHGDIDAWFDRQMPQLQPIVRQLDEAIRATIPDLHYAVKWKRPYYGRPARSRYVKITSLDQATDAELLGWIRQAGHTPGWQ